MKGIRKLPGNEGAVVLSKEFFEREPVFAAAAKFTNIFFVMIQPYGEDCFEVSFKPKVENVQDPDAIEKFCNELIEQQVRHDLQKQFGRLRDMIVSHAFSPIEKQ